MRRVVCFLVFSALTAAAAPEAAWSSTQQPPVIGTPVTGSYQQAAVGFQGTADPDADLVALYEKGVELSEDVPIEGAWSVTHSFTVGAHTVYARSRSAGVWSGASASVTFDVDTNRPQVALYRPAEYTAFGVTTAARARATDQAPGDSGVASLEFQYVDAVTCVEYRSRPACACPASEVNVTDAPPPPGLYQVTVVAADRVGLSRTDSILLLIVP